MAPFAPARARSSRSSRPTRTPTARSPSRRPCAPTWAASRCSSRCMSNGWVPRLVALDIDGTLLKWIEGAGTTYEEIAPAVGDAVGRARDAGCHVVLASGRSPDGMTSVADMLQLHLDGAERLWIV